MSKAQDTIVINLNEDLHLEQALSKNGIESHTLSRNGLDGVTGITLVVTLVASATPMVLMMKHNSNEQVIELLLSARLRDTTRIKTEIYKHFSKIIELFTGAHNINAPKLIIDYSLNRRTEHIKVSGESFIIYDQSLGQSLNLLNTIVCVESQDTSDRNFALDVYASKILAQEFRLRNMKDISL